MSYQSKTSKLGENEAKVFKRLERCIDHAELGRIIDDYLFCCQRGGNLEPGMVREDGVSFNPRLARILWLLVVDGGMRDSAVLRTALYAATLDAVPQAQSISVELLAAIQAARSSTPETASAALIRGVIELDTVRHIHQTDFSSDDRSRMLARAQSVLSHIVRAQAPEWVCTKLNHAINLQLRVS